MTKAKAKNTTKGGGTAAAKGKKTSSGTVPKAKVVAAASKRSKARSRRVQDESSDEDQDEEEIESAEEIEEPDDDRGTAHESQEAPELVESNYLETQQKDEMAELKKRLESKRMSKLKKTMKSRVSQFDDMYAKGMDELEQIEQSPAEKKLQTMFEGFKAFLEDCARKEEEDPEDLIDIMEPLENTSKGAGTACYKFAKRDLSAKGASLARTREIITSRPKLFADSAKDIGDHITEELDQMEQKNEDRLDARKFLKEHFKSLAKYSGGA